MPYARLTTFRLRSADRARLEQVADEANGPIRAMSGFRSLLFFISNDNREGSALSVWDTREQAEAVTAAIRDRAQQTLQEGLEGPPTTHIHEIYEPKG